MKRTIHEVVSLYQHRIVAVLSLWSEAFSRIWPTTDLMFSFYEGSMGEWCYGWWFEAEIAPDRKAKIQVILETETDLDDEGDRFVRWVHCGPWVYVTGINHVEWEPPSVSLPPDDEVGFEQTFVSLEQVPGTDIVSAIERHLAAKSSSD